MISDSPHLYRQAAPEGVDPSVLDNAIAHARLVEESKLPAILTLNHLATLTGVQYNDLRGIVSREDDNYAEFRIAKRSGGATRTIASPIGTTRRAQSWILRHVLNRTEPHHASYAYQRHRSIAKCAERHLGARWLIKFDLHDFFHSVDEARVFCVFKSFGYQPLISFELARVCTRLPHGSNRLRHVRKSDPARFQAIEDYGSRYLGFLPQGSPTSGSLANHAARQLDLALDEYAAQYEFVYTRYADDMVFSTKATFNRSAATDRIRAIEKAIVQNGFSPHRKKTQLTPPGARKIVLGLLVDGDVVRLTRRHRSRIHQHLRGSEKFGVLAHSRSRGFVDPIGFIRHFSGLLNFANDIEPAWTSEYRAAWENLLTEQGYRPSRLYML